MKRVFFAICLVLALCVSVSAFDIQYSNKYLAERNQGNIDWTTDSFKIILMDTTYTFNRDTHHSYTDVSSDELATGYGYTQNTKTLTLDTTSIENDTNDSSDISVVSVEWVASGGTIGPVVGAIIFDDTVSDYVVCYIDFDGEMSVTDTNTLGIYNILFREVSQQ
jgi:hypothetical protein